MQAQLGPEYPAFAEALAAPPPTSLRLHPAKPTELAFELGTPIPWAPGGYYLGARPNFGHDPAWHAGAYYVQEASSMCIGLALPQTQRPLRALDLAAAPGGKTTLLASALPAGSLLVANEPIASRNAILRENVARWGTPGVVVSQNDPAEFAPLAGFFDLVLLDAPCTGEGLWRKQPEAIGQWSEAALAHCAARQHRLLPEAARLVAPGGRLVYSTCSYAPSENAGPIAALLRSQPGQWAPVPLPAAQTYGLVPDAVGGYQAYPHWVRGEGFYLCVLERLAGPAATGGALPRWDHRPVPPAWAPWLADASANRTFFTPLGSWVFPVAHADPLARLQAVLRLKTYGTALTETQGKTEKPAHSLALSTAVSSAVPTLALDAPTAARRFLAGEALAHTDGGVAGWVRVTYRGLGLGWGKAAAGRLNNHVPPAYRLRGGANVAEV